MYLSCSKVRCSS